MIYHLKWTIGSLSETKVFIQPLLIKILASIPITNFLVRQRSFKRVFQNKDKTRQETTAEITAESAVAVLQVWAGVTIPDSDDTHPAVEAQPCVPTPDKPRPPPSPPPPLPPSVPGVGGPGSLLPW